MSWVQKAPIPESFPGLADTATREHGTAGIGDKLYVMGGTLPNIFGGPVSDLAWEYDEPSDTWTALAYLPAPRSAHGCAAVGSKVYVAGGVDSSGSTVCDTLYEYNPATDTWATKATMPAARASCGTVAIGTKLYVIGGGDTIERDTLYEWDQGSNTWATKASLPVTLQLPGAAAVGTDIYVFGGFDGTNFVDTVYKWDQGTDTWSTLGSMPVADDQFHHAVERGTDILLCGGQASGIDDPVGGNLDKSTLYSYDTLTDSWTTLDPLPEFRWVVSNAGTSSYFYVIAGWSGSQTFRTLYRWTASGGDGGPSDGGCVRAIVGSAEADESWAGDGSTTSGTTSALPSDRYDYAGGSNGSATYYLTIDDDGATFQWWVDVWDATRTTITDRWEITGWTSDAAAVPYYAAGSSKQHCTADATNVVVLAEIQSVGSGGGADGVGVAVFDTAGTLLDQWTTTIVVNLSDYTGSCIADGVVYFGAYDSSFDEKVVAVDLATGTASILFAIADVDTAILAVDGTWDGLNVTNGIVEIDGDLIINGGAGLARVQQDGSPVWWQPYVDPDSIDYYALAHSGRGSVWACPSGLYTADEFQYDGTFVQTIALPEPATQAWLGPCGGQRGGWTFGIRF